MTLRRASLLLTGLVALVLALVLAGSASATDTSGAALRSSPDIWIPIPRPVSGLAKVVSRPVALRPVRVPRPIVPRWRLIAPPTSTPRVGLTSDLVALRNAPDVKWASAALRRISKAGDRYERVAVKAFCWGVEQLANYLDDAKAYFSEPTWESIFFEFLQASVQDYYHPYAVQVVDRFLTVLNLAQMHPLAAIFYLRAC
jgi:hypothetical protein